MARVFAKPGVQSSNPIDSSRKGVPINRLKVDPSRQLNIRILPAHGEGACISSCDMVYYPFFMDTDAGIESKSFPVFHSSTHGFGNPNIKNGDRVAAESLTQFYCDYIKEKYIQRFIPKKDAAKRKDFYPLLDGFNEGGLLGKTSKIPYNSLQVKREQRCYAKITTTDTKTKQSSKTLEQIVVALSSRFVDTLESNFNEKTHAKETKHCDCKDAYHPFWYMGAEQGLAFDITPVKSNNVTTYQTSNPEVEVFDENDEFYNEWDALEPIAEKYSNSVYKSKDFQLECHGLRNYDRISGFNVWEDEIFKNKANEIAKLHDFNGIDEVPFPSNSKLVNREYPIEPNPLAAYMEGYVNLDMATQEHGSIAPTPIDTSKKSDKKAFTKGNLAKDASDFLTPDETDDLPI
jgi:hypothetical protein